MSQQTPYEQIRFINDVIKDRQEKNQPTFFSVKLERFGALTPLATKENGASFYETIIQYLTKYDMSAMIIELFNGKSHNVKDPFQTFKIIVKRNAEISGLGDSKIDELRITPTETVITTEKYFFTMAEKERQVMMLEFDIKRLQYENEELRKKNKKKKNYIAELQTEIGTNEKDKKNSIGNVSMGLIGANLVENIVKSPFGTLVLKGFGMDQERLNGLMGAAETPVSSVNEPRSMASIIPSKEEPKNDAAQQPLTQDQQKRIEIKKSINNFLECASDATIRLYYELIQYLGSDNETLQSVIQQLKTFREAQKAIIQENINKSANDKPKGNNETPNNSGINDSS